MKYWSEKSLWYIGWRPMRTSWLAVAGLSVAVTLRAPSGSASMRVAGSTSTTVVPAELDSTPVTLTR